MRPAKFKQANRTLSPPSGQAYSDNVDGVNALHVWADGEQCVSLWQMSWRERLAALFYGRVWVAVLSGETQPPIYAEASKSYFADGES